MEICQDLRSSSNPAKVMNCLDDRRFGWCSDCQCRLEVTAQEPAPGAIYLDYLDWRGVPKAKFRRLDGAGQMWLRAWVNAVDDAGTRWPEAFHLSQEPRTRSFHHGRSRMAGLRGYFGNNAASRPRFRFSSAGSRAAPGLRFLAHIKSNGAYCQASWGNRSVRRGQVSGGNWNDRTKSRWRSSGTEIAGRVDGKEIVRIDDKIGSLSDGGFAFVCEEGLSPVKR